LGEAVLIDRIPQQLESNQQHHPSGLDDLERVGRKYIEEKAVPWNVIITLSRIM
jgi:hypothetical protein